MTSMTKFKDNVLVNFGDQWVIWIPSWLASYHPLWQGEGAPGSGQQYEHIRHLLAQMPPEFVRLVADAAIDELAELQANEHAGHGAVSERQWTRVDLPYAGDPSLQ